MPVRMISHYRIVRRLGAGGMGEVFLAQDTQLERPVALKVMSAELAKDLNQRKRFRTEAKAASGLAHPHICVIHEVGETEDGRPFLAMEYVEGRTLDVELQQRRLKIREVITLAIEMAEALAAAHARGLVHRDIKPANLMLDQRGQVKVLDFGLAKRFGPDELTALTTSAAHTQTGMLIGTPHYMSPEQVLGRELGPRTDIFSLGVVLYELVAGQRPFLGRTVGETINNIVNQPPPPLGLENPVFSPALDNLIFKCLEKEPEKRYASAKELADDLRKLKQDSERALAAATQEKTPAPVARPAPGERPPTALGRRVGKAGASRNAALGWTIGLVVVALLAVGGWLLLRGGGSNSKLPVPGTHLTATAQQKSVAVLPFVNLSEDKENAFFADGIHEDILTTLALVRDLRVVSRTSVAQYRATTKPMRQIAQELGVAYVLEGSVRRAGNKVRVTGQLIRAASDEHVWAKSYDRDLTDIFAIQSELATEIAGALRAVLSPQEKLLMERRPTDSLPAYDLYLKGRAVLKGTRTDLSRAQAEQALAEAVKLDPHFAAAWGLLALAHVQAVFNEEDHSPERLARAKAAIETAVRLAPGDPDVVEMQGSYYYYGYRDYARAAEHYQRLLLLRPNSADAYSQLGFLLRRQARWADALANLRHAFELDPRNVSVANGLAELLQALHRYDEAIVLSRRVAELANGDLMLECARFVPFILAHGSTRECEEWLASLKPAPADEKTVLFLRRTLARARGDWAQAVKIDQEQPYIDPYDTSHWTQDSQMIVDLVGANSLPAARARAEALLPQFRTLLDQQPANPGLWSAAATLHLALEDKEAALRCARKAVELLPESADAVAGPGYSSMLARVLAWTGDKDGALAELARLLRTPYGENVYMARTDPGWFPLRGDPRFEALLNDPANNAPLP